MKSNIARFFLDEIEGWKQQIEGIYDETDMLEKKLEAVVRQNTISGIAAATEAHQNLLDEQSRNLDTLLNECEGQELSLSALIGGFENGNLPQPLRDRQDRLRKKMRKVEKEYLDVKFSCHDFVSEMLK